MKDILNFLKNTTYEKRVFYIFLIVHVIVWSCIGLIRTVLPTDSLEGIYWGSFADFGTPKHPPLAGWLTYLAYMPFKADFSIYLLSQLFILGGFIYIYKLAKCFLDENKSMLSVIILEGCWCYSYVTGYYGFNPDVILLFTLPAISYYFYKCITTQKQTNWIILGLLVGISFLNKYQTGLLIAPMFIWACIFKRDIFKNKFFYIAIFIAFLIFLPHLLWLINYDFYPLLYFEGELTATSWFNHITAPLNFLLMQLAAIGGSLLIFLVLKWKDKSAFNIVLNDNKKDIWFLILLGLVPLVIHLLMGICEGGTMRPRWGYEFWFMLGIMLFYFFPCKTERENYIFTTKLAYLTMLIIFISLGTLLLVEKNYRSRYPVATVMNDLNTIWTAQYKTPLKYIGGYIEWTLPLTIYGNTHPKCILDNHGYPDPWISKDELKKHGIMIIDRKLNELEYDTRMSCPYLPADYKIEPQQYSFTLYNALGMPRKYTIYYLIIPPSKY